MAGTMQRCNVLIAGVPGVGKTSLAGRVAERLGSAFPSVTPAFDHLDVGKIIAAEGLHDGVDEAYMSAVGALPQDTVHILNEDKVVDALEERLWGTAAAPSPGHKVVDFHTVDFFPERWFQVVVLLRCIETAVLFERLEHRGYPLPKVQENVQAEIMDVVANDVRDSYDESIILELPSVKPSDMDDNCEAIVEAVGRVLGVAPLPDPEG